MLYSSPGVENMSALLDEIKKRSEIIDRAIEKYLPIDEPEELYKASRHLIKAGGKRLRPVTVLISTEAIEGNTDIVIPAAIAIETIHNFTLIHDDIMDNDTYRRGVPTVHTKWDVPTAILAGDTLFAEAFRILCKSSASPDKVVSAVNMLSDVCVKICEGQQMDMEFEKRTDVSEEEYMEMIRKKTAVLYAASSSIGPVLNGVDDKTVRAMWNYGEKVGMGFQIYDDVLDLIGNRDKLGKDWGSDLVQGKKTLVAIHALNRGVNLEVFGRGKASEDEIERDVQRLRDSGSIDYALKIARSLVDEGISSLDVLDDNPGKKLLIELAEFLITREY